MHFFNEKYYILIQIPHKFVRNDPVDNIMACHQLGNKPLSEPLISVMHMYSSLSHNELKLSSNKASEYTSHFIKQSLRHSFE